MMSKKFVYAFLFLLSACVPGAPTATPSPEPSPTPRLPQFLCLVTDVGRVNDGTFNQYAYEGMQNLAADHPALRTDYIETENEEDYGRNINDCIERGADIVITVGFLITNATAEAARANPDVYFIGVDQDVSAIADAPTNYAGTQAREDQVGFLVGVIAAVVANDMGGNVVAGVYGIDVPAVKRFRNGYEQGVLHVNPDWVIGENILGAYTDSFLAPEVGAELALGYIEEGAVVIFGAGGPTGSGGITAAAEAGVYVIGVDKDEYFTTFLGGEAPGSEFIITSAIKRVDTAVYDVARLLVEGNTAAFPGGSNYNMTVANNGVGYAGSHDAEIPAEAFEQAELVFQQMVNGELDTGVDPVSGDLIAAPEATAEASEAASEEATAEATEE